jgi:O-acetyl-ADP-ribose deacetylase (regulator of RNase III)/cold shock CspA family protein
MSPAGLKYFKAHLKSACPVEVTEAKTVATPFIDVAPQHEPSLQNFLNESLYQDHYPVSTEIFDRKIITQTIQSLKKRLQDEKSNAILHPLLQMKCPLGDCKCQPKDTAALKLHIRKYCNFSVQNTGSGSASKKRKNTRKHGGKRILNNEAKKVIGKLSQCKFPSISIASNDPLVLETVKAWLDEELSVSIEVIEQELKPDPVLNLVLPNEYYNGRQKMSELKWCALEKDGKLCHTNQHLRSVNLWRHLQKFPANISLKWRCVRVEREIEVMVENEDSDFDDEDSAATTEGFAARHKSFVTEVRLSLIGRRADEQQIHDLKQLLLKDLRRCYPTQAIVECTPLFAQLLETKFASQMEALLVGTRDETLRVYYESPIIIRSMKERQSVFEVRRQIEDWYTHVQKHSERFEIKCRRLQVRFITRLLNETERGAVGVAERRLAANVFRGVIKTWDQKRGFGFIQPSQREREDIFFHKNQAKNAGELREGTTVTYSVGTQNIGGNRGHGGRRGRGGRDGHRGRGGHRGRSPPRDPEHSTEALNVTPEGKGNPLADVELQIEVMGDAADVKALVGEVQTLIGGVATRSLTQQEQKVFFSTLLRSDHLRLLKKQFQVFPRFDQSTNILHVYGETLDGVENCGQAMEAILAGLVGQSFVRQEMSRDPIPFNLLVIPRLKQQNIFSSIAARHDVKTKEIGRRRNRTVCFSGRQAAVQACLQEVERARGQAVFQLQANQDTFNLPTDVVALLKQDNFAELDRLQQTNQVILMSDALPEARSESNMAPEDLPESAQAGDWKCPCGYHNPLTAYVCQSCAKRPHKKQANFVGAIKGVLVNSRVKLCVAHGDLLESKADGIVNSANSQLRHDAGIAKAIADRAGQALINESIRVVREQKRQSVLEGKAVLTTAGRLARQFKGVIHAVPPMYANDDTRSQSLIFECTYNSLQLAHDQNWTSLALPVFGVGIYGTPLNVACSSMFRAVRSFVHDHKQTSLTKLTIIDVDEKHAEAFAHELEQPGQDTACVHQIPPQDPYQWYWEEWSGGKHYNESDPWVAYDSAQSQQLEEAKNTGRQTVTIRGDVAGVKEARNSEYEVDLKEMMQTNVSSGLRGRRRVQRRDIAVPVTQTPPRTVHLSPFIQYDIQQYSGGSTLWKVYAFEQKHIDAFHTSLRLFTVRHTESEEIPCSQLPKDYQAILVDQIQEQFNDMKVTLIERNNIPIVVLRGMRSSLTKASNAVLRRYTEFLIKGTETSFPGSWAPQSRNQQLFDIKAQTAEFKAVASRLQETMPNAQLKRLQRVQYKSLWTSFQANRKAMEAKLGRATVSEQLFHGSGVVYPQTLLDNDVCFDKNFSNQGMWGRGCYFAVNASYSNNYAHSLGSNEKQFFLADVLVGDWLDKTATSSLVRIVDKNPQTNNDYDSYRGHTGGSYIFILYRDYRSYPTYLITYTA